MTELSSDKDRHCWILKGSHKMGDGQILLKICAPFFFNKYLLNEPNFSQIHLATVNSNFKKTSIFS